MFIFKSIVGKLWITIIGLVVAVLLTLSVFLFKYIETSFPKSQDQVETLNRLAQKVANEISLHKEERGYLQVLSEILNAQEASVIVVTRDFIQEKPSVSRTEHRPDTVSYSDFFTNAELEAVFSGQMIDNRKQNASLTPSLSNQFTAVAVPYMNQGQTSVEGALIMFQLTQSSEETQNYVKKIFVVVGVIGFLMTTFFAFFLLTRITQPLMKLKKAADLISEGEYGSRVQIVSSDEIGELGKTFNNMGEQLQDTIKALNHEKEHLASVLRSMGDAVITFDAEGKVILTNPQGERLISEWNHIEWPEQQTDTDKPFGKPKGDIPQPMLPLFEEVIANPKEMTSKLLVRNEVWSIALAPLYAKDIVRGVVAVMRDVTEENRLDKLRKDFVANVSHELRTPLSMLQGYSEALLDDIASTPEDRKELAQVIHEESLRMGRLVHDLLDLARMETGKMEFNFRELDVQAFIKRIHRKFAALSKEKGIALSYSVSFPSLTLRHADEDRLEQVLTNLLDNALRHTPAEAQVRIEAKQVSLRGQDAVLIEVSDEGYGIPAEDLPYIFERFYKADKARTRIASGGTGLGLSIAKNIVEAHQGLIQVKSHPGQGTTFSITLPC